MKLGQIFIAKPALDKVAGAELSPKILYRVSKMLSVVDEELKFIEQNRSKLICELGEEVHEGEWRVKDENMQEYAKRFNEFLDIDSEADISVIEIPTTENVRLSFKDLSALKGFIELRLDEE